MRGPCFRACCATHLRCFGGSRRQTSQSVSAAVTGPTRRVSFMRGIAPLCPFGLLAVVSAVPAVVVPVVVMATEAVVAAGVVVVAAVLIAAVTVPVVC